MSPANAHQLATFAAIAVILLIVGLRVRRMTQGRRLRLETLWIRPVIYAVIAGFLIAATPPKTVIDIAFMAAAFVVGAAIGWRQAKLMVIGIEPESHQLNVKASPLAVMLVLGIFGLRFAVRSLLPVEAAAWKLNAGLIVDCLMVLVVGLYVAQAIEMFIRASAMLRQARAGRTKAA